MPGQGVNLPAAAISHRRRRLNGIILPWLTIRIKGQAVFNILKTQFVTYLFNLRPLIRIATTAAFTADTAPPVLLMGGFPNVKHVSEV